MAEYIDRQVALDALGATKNATKYGGDHSGYDTKMLYEIHDALTGIPAADVVPVVRCEDCKHHSFDAGYGNYWCNLTSGVRKVKRFDFCSYGERKE